MLPSTDHSPPSDYGRWLLEVSPTFSWAWEWQSRVRYYLDSIDRGELDRLAIAIPPRHGKSELVTIRRPAYILERDPSANIVIGAYSSRLATKFSRKTRGLVRFRNRVALDPERQAADEWTTTQGGGLRAVGVSAGITGEGADEIIIDDPVKSRAEANSFAYREAVWDWYRDDLYTRLEPEGRIIVIMTRWHEDDLMGRIFRSDEGKEWTLCHLPALAEENDELGRAPGEALCSERFTKERLHRIKAVLGRGFHALYQGRPVAQEGNIILSEWFQYYDRPETEYQQIVQSWDTANKDRELNDWSVCTTWGVGQNNYDLLREWRKRVQFPELLAAAKKQAEIWNPKAILIEDAGNGTALIQMLRAETSLPVIAISPVGDKIMRLSNESPAYESGLVRHPKAHAHSWIVDFEAELVTIPHAPNDDRGDSVSQFLKWIKRGTARNTVSSIGSRRFSHA